ncbi:MAG: 16S rRNA (guanine(527)-N(7))-methyltransferase RsmG [Firmicutes bacterium]|nr:16S rRNA (guanine(527)-N(7))-methyltransferase RsmG [[Eubacterium] siraeum]MCM1488266.1 16S rRNA (guanine(527)-N(7))-methyltransferase RsmG [Bacillota bacterium]
MTEDIKNRFEAAKIPITEKQAEQLDKMTVFLQDYCQKVNLTAIRDREGIIEKHLVDSVLPLTLTELPRGEKCLDIGTGAGFPAVPMMIFRPDLKFTLLDAQRKRTDYLTLLSKELGIFPEIIHGRAEELGRQPQYKKKYGMITARAVSDLPTLLKYAAPMLKAGGNFLAMRGSKEELTEEVIRAAEKLKLTLNREIEYKLPCGDGRRLIIFERK